MRRQKTPVDARAAPPQVACRPSTAPVSACFRLLSPLPLPPSLPPFRSQVCRSAEELTPKQQAWVMDLLTKCAPAPLRIRRRSAPPFLASRSACGPLHTSNQKHGPRLWA